MNSKKKPRGRPKADLKLQRTEIFNAAMKVLVAQGYQKATTLLIAQTCGISKQTLYKQFPSKEALFIALVEHRAAGMNDMLATALEEAPLDLEKVLKRFGRLLMGVLTSDVSVAINRACMAAAGSHDLGLSQTYYEHAQKPVFQKLMAVLELARSDDIIIFEDIDVPFQALLGLCYGDLLSRRLLGVVSAPDKEIIADKVDIAVGQFMRIFLP